MTLILHLCNINKKMTLNIFNANFYTYIKTKYTFSIGGKLKMKEKTYKSMHTLYIDRHNLPFHH